MELALHIHQYGAPKASRTDFQRVLRPLAAVGQLRAFTQFFFEETARRPCGEFLTVKIASLARATSIGFFPHLHRIILAQQNIFRTSCLKTWATSSLSSFCVEIVVKRRKNMKQL